MGLWRARAPTEEKQLAEKILKSAGLWDDYRPRTARDYVFDILCMIGFGLLCVAGFVAMLAATTLVMWPLSLIPWPAWITTMPEITMDICIGAGVLVAVITSCYVRERRLRGH